MSTPNTPDTIETNEAAVTETPAPAAAPESAHPDPITGEPGAHPVGVGVGALGAGAAGAAIGAIGGPIGMLIGAAIGAVAGGLAGKEVAASESSAEADMVAESAAPPAVFPVDAPFPVVPGEEIRASSGAAFSSESRLPEVAGDPVPTSGSTVSGFQAAPVPEAKPLAGALPSAGDESVRTSAYYLYVERSATGAPGDEVGDWLEAERRR